MKIIILLLCICQFKNAASQKIIEEYIPATDSLRIGYSKSDFLPYGARGYTLILPETVEIKATIISLEDYPVDLKDSAERGFIYSEANARGYAFLYISTGLPVDLFFTNSSLSYVDETVKKVFTKNQIPNKNIFLQGIMTSGHRALKYIEYCKKGKSLFRPAVKGVYLCESVLDWVRQWYEGQKQVRDSLSEAGFFEGNLVTYLFKKHLKDSPVTNIEKYLEFSPYCYFDTKMRKIPFYKDIAVRAYTFADTDYWFSAPGKGVYDSNYPDMSGIINELKLAGSTKAELIVLQKENKTGHHAKQSSTWELVDKTDLLDWVTKQIN